MPDAGRPSRWTRASRTADLVGSGPFALSAGDHDLVAVRVGD
jgi:hypothetical protein